jgi:hypothetical protein
MAAMPVKGVPRIIEEDDAFEYAFVGDITDVSYVTTISFSSSSSYSLPLSHSLGRFNRKRRHPPKSLRHRVRSR